jgi:branched-chain amino acid transport system permease protein
MFDLYVSAVIYGLSISAILLLVSIGICIGFGLMRIINMEQMVYYTFGAYLTYAVVASVGSFWLGVLAGTLAAAGIGFIVETQLLRRVYGQELMFTMVVTFSVFLMGIGIVQYVFGLASKPVGQPFNIIVRVFDTMVPLYRLLVVAISIVVYVFIHLFLNKTIFGKAIRAGIENPDQVQGLGIDIRRIFTITFIVASGLAGFGGALHAPFRGVTPYMGFDMLLFAFITVILGGLGASRGPWFLHHPWPGDFRGGTLYAPFASVGPFIVMFIVILLKPTGALWGKRKSLRL